MGIQLGRSVALGLVLALVAGAGFATAAGPYPNPLPDFAHPNSPHRLLLSTTGGNLDRPMLVLYAKFTDREFPVNQGGDFMATRFFGAFPSVAHFYATSSFGKLMLTRATESQGTANDGVVQVSIPMNHEKPGFDAQNADQQNKQIIQAADAFVNFASFDANNDNNIRRDELIIVVVKALPENICGANFPVAQITLDGKAIDYPDNSVPLIGLGANMVTLIHEVSHAALQTIDLYAVAIGIGQLDLMGGTQCSGNDTRLWDLNSWHKTHLGWIAPTVVTGDGYYNVSRYDTTGTAFLLYDPSKNVDNYFLVENRTQSANSYDQLVIDRGLVIWRIDDALFSPNNKWIEVMRPDAMTNLKDDGKDAFDPSDFQTPQRTMDRKWRDGTDSNVAVRAIGDAGAVVRAYFDVRGPGVLVDTYDQLKKPVFIIKGQTDAVSFPVMNTGEATDTFAFTLTIPNGWTASADTQTLTAGASSTATIQVTPSINVATGMYTLNATGHSVNDVSIQSSSPIQVFVLARPTTLVYTGDLTADYHDPAALSATLTDTISGTPLAGQVIDFTLGTQTASATTSSAGVASASIVLSQTPGLVVLKADYAGDATYQPSDDKETFTITREETTTTYIGPTVILQGASGVTLTAQLLEDGTTAPVPFGQTITLSLGAQSCTGTTDASGTASCTLTFNGALGPQPLKADFAGDAYYLPSADTGKTAIVFAFPSYGAFVLGDDTVAAATPSTVVTWWDSNWSGAIELSGGESPSAFKGFADTIASLPTTSPASTCSGTWTSSGGNSAPPTTGVPSYMGVLVTSSVAKSGTTIAGNFSEIVVVITDPGYAPGPGHSGTGRIVATFCQ